MYIITYIYIKNSRYLYKIHYILLITDYFCVIHRNNRLEFYFTINFFFNLDFSFFSPLLFRWIESSRSFRVQRSFDKTLKEKYFFDPPSNKNKIQLHWNCVQNCFIECNTFTNNILSDKWNTSAPILTSDE